jgi:hypothetical protein
MIDPTKPVRCMVGILKGVEGTIYRISSTGYLMIRVENGGKGIVMRGQMVMAAANEVENI